MVIKEISRIDDLQSDESKNLTVVHFYADWADECKHINEILEAVASREEYDNINFKKCAAETHPNISTSLKVTAVPTVLFFKNGKKIDEITGADPTSLNSKLRKYSKKSCNEENDITSIIGTSMIVACIQDEPAQSESNKELSNILESSKAKFSTVNVLENDSVKQTIVSFSGRSTFPQLYIKGEFVGDLQNVKQLNSTGELSFWIEAAVKNLNKTLVKRLSSLIKKSDIMVFMKGDKDAPRCGFSKQLMEILKETGLPFDTFDILADEDVRQGLKIYSNWPTYPQVYVKGELIGGLDIIKSLKEDDELVSTLRG